MREDRPAQSFSQLALVITLAMGLIYILVVLSGILTVSLFTNGLGLIIAAPLMVFVYIFVALIVQRWKTRDRDPYSDLEK